MGITFSIGEVDPCEDRGLLERRRQRVPESAPSRDGRDAAAPGWVLDQPRSRDDEDLGTTWAW